MPYATFLTRKTLKMQIIYQVGCNASVGNF